MMLKTLMLKNLEEFPIGAHFSIFAGSHGSDDGNFGDTTEAQRGSMINEYSAMIANIKSKQPDVIKKRKYKFEGVKPIGKVGGYLNHEVHDDLLDAYMEQILKDKHPHVILLGFCYSNKSVLVSMMMELGVLPVVAAKMERGMISNGTCHKVAKNQRKPLKVVKDDHIEHKNSLENAKSKNVFLWGSTGTGKTEILKLILRMRIAFHKRIHQKNSCKINVIIGAYRTDAKNLMKVFEEDFSDLLSDEKLNVQFKSFGIT